MHVCTLAPSSAGEARTAADASSATRARWMAMRDSGCTPRCPAAVATSRSSPASRAAPSGPICPGRAAGFPAVFVSGRFAAWRAGDGGRGQTRHEAGVDPLGLHFTGRHAIY
nr:unnamed protein product [Digitaria exilis]